MRKCEEPKSRAWKTENVQFCFLKLNFVCTAHSDGENLKVVPCYGLDTNPITSDL